MDCAIHFEGKSYWFTKVDDNKPRLLEKIVIEDGTWVGINKRGQLFSNGVKSHAIYPSVDRHSLKMLRLAAMLGKGPDLPTIEAVETAKKQHDEAYTQAYEAGQMLDAAKALDISLPQFVVDHCQAKIDEYEAIKTPRPFVRGPNDHAPAVDDE
jgi:hypothetical protein